MTVSQADKAKKFRALHEAPGAFVIANPWDGGSARLLAGLGFQALATSSGAKAGVLGKRDGKVTREEALANARMIVEACDLPVAADLEKGFGEAPGADVLMSPGLPDLAAVKKVCSALNKPFNFMVGIKGRSFTKADLEAAGVKRISLATSLYRAAMTGLLDAAKEVKEKGTFTYLDRAIPTPDLNAFMKE